MTPPTVYIVDDDAAVRDALSLLLGLKGIRARTFPSAEDFLEALNPEWTGCILIDLRMPGMGGMRLHEQLVQRGVRVPVIIVTAHGDVAAAKTALKAGAVDFIEKPIDDAQLLAAIGSALDIDAARRRRLAEARELGARMARLTAREREVLDRVVAGRHNREIAAELGISPRTVEVYKGRMMEKLQVQRLPDLVRLVVAAGGIDPGR